MTHINLNKKKKYSMNTFYLLIISILFSLNIFGQSQIKEIEKTQKNELFDKGVYQLYATKNIWTFIKLDTRNGRMWQVHFSIKDDEVTGEIVLNSESLVNEGKQAIGRYKLYPTENIYNFLLLDQIDGNVFQVQWSMDNGNRGILTIF